MPDAPKIKKPKVCASTDKSMDVSDNASTSKAVDKKLNSTVAENQIAKNEMEQALLCSVCFEIIHDCVSIQPCQHCFCAGCLSDWLQKQNTCPECRFKVKKVARNHRMNSLINAFLLDKPDKKRSADELAILDAKNVFTKDLTLHKQKINGDLDSTDHDDSLSDDDDDSTSTSTSSSSGSDDENLMNLAVDAFSRRIKNAGYSPMQVPVCVQCKNYGQGPYQALQNLIGRPTNTTVPPYICPKNQCHVSCTCCGIMIPDRRSDPACANTPIECCICHNIFCHMYFGCRLGCKGCLNKFKDLTFDSVDCSNLINGNVYETKMLQNSLTAKNMSWQDFFHDCMAKLDSNVLNCRDKTKVNLNSTSVVCRRCALTNFRDLSYEYRKTSCSDLNDKRENCWYGRNCRTQKHCINHAMKLNHICEQSKFK